MLDYAVPKVNIRARGFDFDSDEPVEAQLPKPSIGLMPAVIDYLFVIVIVLCGWRLADWWFHGGWIWLSYALDKWLPWLSALLGSIH